MLLNRPWPPTAETGQQKERMRQIRPPDASSFIATSAILRSRAAPALPNSFEFPASVCYIVSNTADEKDNVNSQTLTRGKNTGNKEWG